MSNHEKTNKNKILLIEIIIGIFSGILMILLYYLFSHLIIVKLGISEFISPILYIFIPCIIWRVWQLLECMLVKKEYHVHFFFIKCFIPMVITIFLVALYLYYTDDPIGVIYGLLCHIIMLIAMIEMSLLKNFLDTAKINKKCNYIDFVWLGIVFAWCIVQLIELLRRWGTEQEYISILIYFILGIIVGLFILINLFKHSKNNIEDNSVDFDWKIGILFSIISLFITSGIFALFVWAAPF